MTVDNDGGAIVFRPQRAGTASIVSGKISLNGATLPKLLFDYRALSGTKGALELEIIKKDGTSSKIWESNFAPYRQVRPSGTMLYWIYHPTL